MTAHELAAKLLAGEDLPVSISVYTGGDDEIKEIEDCIKHSDDYSSPVVLLITYKA